MRLFIILISFCVFLVHTEAGLTNEEMMAAVKALSQKCKEETGASDANLEAFLQHIIDPSPTGKCLRTCMMLKFEVITPDGKLVRDKILKLCDFLVNGDPEKMKKSEEIVDDCMDVTDPDQCEAGFKISSCLNEGVIAKNLGVTW